MKRSKAYQQALEKIEEDKIYSPMGAIKIIKDTVSTKFDPTIDVSMCMGVDPRKADQMVRGTVNLPHGTGKTSRVLVFASGEKADEAREAGADFVGADDMLEKVSAGWTDFDAVVATPVEKVCAPVLEGASVFGVHKDQKALGASGETH